MLCREFLDELQKVKQIPICKRQHLPRISVNSVTLKLIDALNEIINLVKGEPDMREISYLVYTAASLSVQKAGLKDGKVNQISNTDMETKTAYGDSCTLDSGFSVVGS